MADLLSIGASGVRAYQGALTTVSENIASAGVDGYSRRVATLKEIRSVGGPGSISLAGSGVALTGIARSSDPYLEASVRTAGADLARTEIGVGWLDRIEQALTGDKLGDRMTAFFASGVALAAEPSSTALRAAMLGAAGSVAIAFTATGDAIERIAADLDRQAVQATSDLNGLAQTLYKVNQGLGRTQPNTSGSAQLADQRDSVLEQMSALADVEVSLDEAGRASVRVGGAGGPRLVDGSGVGEVRYARAGGSVSFAVLREGMVAALSPGGGALAGIVDGAARVDAARAGVDGIAAEFAATVNRFQRQGEDLDGARGQPMFSVGSRPSDLTLAIEDGRGIAAASPGGGPRDASNLAALETARMTKKFEGEATAMVTGNAAALQQRRTIASTQGAIRDGAVTARAAVSGVDLDSEAVDLMRFQQAYQASSRVIQVARETFQSLMEIR